MRAPLALAVAVALTLTLTSVWAHGPAPAPLRVLSVEDGSPSLVYTNIGLAARRDADGSYRYLCPSQWGGLETPILAQSHAGAVLVVGPESLWVADATLCDFVRISAKADMDVRQIRAAAAVGERAVWMAEATGEGSRIWRWQPDEELEVILDLEEGVTDALSHRPGHVLMAGARPNPWVASFDEDGGELEASTSLGDVPFHHVEIPWEDAEGVWVRGTDDEGMTLLFRPAEGPWQIVRKVETALHGPVPLCGGHAAVVDGVVAWVSEVPGRCDLGSLSGEPWTCMGQVGGTTYGCRLRSLFALRPEDGEAQPLFRLESIAGPGTACPSDDTSRSACALDWLHFGAEAGLLGEETVPSDSSPEQGDEPTGGWTCDQGGVSPWARGLVRR